jgi:hypothetical protein
MCLVSRFALAAPESDRPVRRITEILDGLKQQLGIEQPVQVKIVQNNRLAFSVEPADHNHDFILSVDSRFLGQLDDQDLAAALAHELGHIWIYTHHPFLHTEALANEIAMRVIPRDSLKTLYGKLWDFEGSHGDYEELLGAANLTSNSTSR